MQFILNGMRHELDFPTMMAAANRIAPDSLDGRHKYYVDVAGRRIPIKQLFAEATGLRRAEFITDDAFRIFRKLGVEVHEFNSPPRATADQRVLDKPTESESGAHRFAVSLESDEDGYIVASCPQFPGCHSQGRTRQEAVGNIEEAIRGYIASMKHHGEDITIVDWELVRVAL